MQVQARHKPVDNLGLRLRAARQRRMRRRVPQQQLYRVIQKRPRPARRVQRRGGFQLALDRRVYHLAPPIRVHHLLAHRPRQPVGGIVLPEIVPNIARYYRMIQVLERIPIGRAPFIPADRLNKVVYRRPALVARRVHQPVRKPVRERRVRAGALRRHQRLRHRPRQQHQHGMPREKMALRVPIPLRRNKRAAQHAPPQIQLDLILRRPLVSRRKIKERLRQLPRPPSVVNRRRHLDSPINKAIELSQQRVVIRLILKPQRLVQR